MVGIAQSKVILNIKTSCKSNRCVESVLSSGPVNPSPGNPMQWRQWALKKNPKSRSNCRANGTRYCMLRDLEDAGTSGYWDMNNSLTFHLNGLTFPCYKNLRSLPNTHVKQAATLKQRADEKRFNIAYKLMIPTTSDHSRIKLSKTKMIKNYRKYQTKQNFLIGQKAALDGIEAIIHDKQAEVITLKIDELSQQFDTTQCASFLVSSKIPISLTDLLTVRSMTPSFGKKPIRSLKNGKASGICGWHHEELKQLPWQAIQHLTIFPRLWQYSLSFNMMQARVAFFAKCENPKSINDGRPRPIAILPVLYRLAAKVVFDQVVALWAHR